VALDCSGNAAGRLLALQSTADWGRVVYIGETGKVEFEVSAATLPNTLNTPPHRPTISFGAVSESQQRSFS
jgi:threonine dehydrogenase-like Zn-dependent dehydrogenase